jgi:hypothetical protein
MKKKLKNKDLGHKEGVCYVIYVMSPILADQYRSRI